MKKHPRVRSLELLPRKCWQLVFLASERLRLFSKIYPELFPASPGPSGRKSPSALFRSNWFKYDYNRPSDRKKTFFSSKTDDNGNALFQSYLSKLLKKKTAEDTLVPPLWGTREKNVCFSRIICSRCCTRRNLRFHVENCQHADQKQLT